MDEMDTGGIPGALDCKSAFDYSIAYGNSINPYFMRSINSHLDLLFEEISYERQCDIANGYRMMERSGLHLTLILKMVVGLLCCSFPRAHIWS